MNDLFDNPPSIPTELRERALAVGWPEELLERWQHLRVNQRLLDFFIEDDRVEPPLVDEVLRERERLTQGSLRVRQTTWEDDEACVEFFANAPEEVGEWQVTTERGPYPFAQFRLMENPALMILEDRSVIIGSVAYSTRNTVVGGHRFAVSVGLAYRVRREFRGAGYGRLVSGVPGGSEMQWWALGNYWYVRTGNFDAYEWLGGRLPDHIADRRLGPDDPPGIPVNVHYLSTENVDADATGIRRATRDDLPACVELINRTHHGLDLFRPYSEEFLEMRLDDCYWGPKPPFWQDVYTWDDFFVLERDDHILACGGLWDRGRHVREVWHSAKTGERRVIDPAALMDFGYAEGHEDDAVRLISFLLDRARDAGRAAVMAAIEYMPALVERLEPHVTGTETRALGWRMSEQAGELKSLVPERPYTDLAYW